MSIDNSTPDVKLFEVGPRDGLQNESRILSVDEKITLINRLVQAGAKDVEIGSFVHPAWIPQMANTDEVARRLTQDSSNTDARYWTLVPNLKGLERAIAAGIRHIAVILSSTEAHSQSNLNRSLAEGLANVKITCEQALAEGMQVRAYISTVFGCPFEGAVDFQYVLDSCAQLLDFGAFQVSLGDTIGVGKPYQVRDGCRQAIDRFGSDAIALHLHDTEGLAIANSLVAFEAGVRNFDSAIGGMGGCPYAPGAAGNVSTEDLLNLFHSIGQPTGWDLDQVCETSSWLRQTIGINTRSRYYAAWHAAQSIKQASNTL